MGLRAKRLHIRINAQIKPVAEHYGSPILELWKLQPSQCRMSGNIGSVDAYSPILHFRQSAESLQASIERRRQLDGLGQPGQVFATRDRRGPKPRRVRRELLNVHQRKMPPLKMFIKCARRPSRRRGPGKTSIRPKTARRSTRVHAAGQFVFVHASTLWACPNS